MLQSSTTFMAKTLKYVADAYNYVADELIIC